MSAITKMLNRAGGYENPWILQLHFTRGEGKLSCAGRVELATKTLHEKMD